MSSVEYTEAETGIEAGEIQPKVGPGGDGADKSWCRA